MKFGRLSKLVEEQKNKNKNGDRVKVTILYKISERNKSEFLVMSSGLWIFELLIRRFSRDFLKIGLLDFEKTF